MMRRQPLLGSHLSIAGGYYRAADAAGAFGMQTVQIFTKNNNQWQGKPLSDDDVIRFRDAVAAAGLRRACAHSSYLINLASADDFLWRRSIDAYAEELHRAERLGLAGVVIHPGSACTGKPRMPPADPAKPRMASADPGTADPGAEEAALDRVVAALDDVLSRTDGLACEVWLETTAGQGSSLGHRFEHLKAILDGVRDSARIGVCADTCHLFAAGYPLRSKAEYAATMSEFDRLVGLGRLRAFHLNDSKRPFGSRVDRHEHIGEGTLGLEPFRHILNDARFADLPMYLETPKGKRGDEELDAINLATLRSLMLVVPLSGGRTPRAKAGRRRVR